MQVKLRRNSATWEPADKQGSAYLKSALLAVSANTSRLTPRRPPGDLPKEVREGFLNRIVSANGAFTQGLYSYTERVERCALSLVCGIA